MTRFLLKLAFALLVGLVCVPALAQPILSDPQGDVAAAIFGQSVKAPESFFRRADLIDLAITESPEAVGFRLNFQGLDATGLDSGAQAFVQFLHGGVEYQLVFTFISSPVPLTVDPTASLNQRPAGSQAWQQVQRYAVEIQETALAVNIPRSELADQDGTPPGPGRRFTDIFVTSTEWDESRTLVGPLPGPGAAVSWHDVMPDAGAGSFEFAMGEAAGELRLTSPRPNRASNGEPTAFVFDTVITNDGHDTRVVTLRTGTPPQGWTLSTPIAAVEVPPGSIQRVPLIAVTSSSHEHGSHVRFSVTLVDAITGASASELVLGVRYHPIAQPAGHHPNLWLHTLEPDSDRPIMGGQGVNVDEYMNTLQADDQDTGARIGPRQLQGPGQEVVLWCVPLTPNLAIGLDFDTQTLGTFTGRIGSFAPLEGELAGRLLVTSSSESAAFTDTSPCTSNTVLVVANLEGVAVAIESNAPRPVDLAVMPTPASDLVQDIAGQNIILELTLDATRPFTLSGTDTPYLEPGAGLQLPLREYRDLLPPATQSNDLMFAMPSHYLLRNPGTAAVVEFTLPGKDLSYMVDLLGVNKEWAALSTPKNPQSGDSIQASVRVPVDATDGQLADLVLRATSNVGDVVLARMVIEVDSGGEHEDDASRVRGSSSSQRASSPGFMVMLMAMTSALVLARRRR